MSNIISIIREELKNFSPYSSARNEASGGQIWLNANESPWRENQDAHFEDLNRYPEQQPRELLEALAGFYKISQDELVVTRGSDEGIDLLFRLFCRSGKDKVIICNPTFGMYEVAARLQGIEIIQVPLVGKEFQLNKIEILANLKDNVKLVFLCSPNNPTGTLLNTSDIIELCEATKRQCIIVVDEAYIEFSTQESLSRKINQYNNLVVLRTLSKAFGLAGIRMGCLIANQEITKWVRKILPPYPLPNPSIEIALKKLEPNNIIQMLDRIKTIQVERAILQSRLENLSIIKSVWPSEANFFLIELVRNIDNDLAASGIVLRNMGKRLNLKNVYRISIGTPEENNTLITFLQFIQIYRFHLKIR
ncbi:MAG TPA: histidinol-phosphate transaminase [Gammaproteobacteria bacterium]|nr:histidinol-phosphate transaminase [Gammaproteobacteria bacterium]